VGSCCDRDKEISTLRKEQYSKNTFQIAIIIIGTSNNKTFKITKKKGKSMG
jgi:hypothetical protein